MTSPRGTTPLPVGVLARFEVRPGTDEEVRRFFAEGRLVVDGQPAATTWFAFRTGPTSYGAFAAFASEQDREALLAAGGPASSRAHAQLFTRPPTFERVEVLEARQPGSDA